MSPPQELTFGDWNGDTASSSNVDIQGDTFTLATAIPDSVVTHFDATELSGFNDGDTVSTWPDEADGNDATASGSPVYRPNAINNNPAIEFDGANDSYDAPVGVTSQPYTFISIVANTGSNGIDAIVGTRSEPLVINEYSHDDDQWQMFAGGNNQTGSGDIGVNVVSARYDGSNSALREDGAETAAGDAGGNDIDALNIGWSAIRTSRYWEGYIGLVEMHDVALTDSEIANREQTLADQWGITL